MPYTLLYKEYVPRVECSSSPVDCYLHDSVENLEGFFFLFVMVVGMPLPWELDDHLLAVATINAID